jgi:hypothetical protein
VTTVKGVSHAWDVPDCALFGGLALAKAYIALTRVMGGSVFGKKPADHSLLRKQTHECNEDLALHRPAALDRNSQTQRVLEDRRDRASRERLSAQTVGYSTDAIRQQRRTGVTLPVSHSSSQPARIRSWSATVLRIVVQKPYNIECTGMPPRCVPVPSCNRGAASAGPASARPCDAG